MPDADDAAMVPGSGSGSDLAERAYRMHLALSVSNSMMISFCCHPGTAEDG
jgi:hypothetical protein